MRTRLMGMTMHDLVPATLIAGCIAMLLSPSQAGGWTPPVNLTRLGSGADAGSAVLGIDGQGRIHVLVSRNGQGTWSLRVEGDVRTELAPLANGVSPAIVGDAYGRAHAFWSEGWEIRYRQWNGSWESNSITISDGSGESLKPHACSDGQNNIHVVWAKGLSAWYNRRSAATGQWDGPQPIPGISDLAGYLPPRVAAVGTTPVVLWGKHNSGNWNAWFSTFESGTWTSTLLDGNSGTSNGDIDVTPEGIVETVWDRGYDIWGRRRVNGSWSDLMPIRVSAVDSLGPRVSAVSASKIDVVWGDRGAGFGDLWSSRWNGSTWSPAASITGNQGGVSPDMAHDSAGTQIAIWSNNWEIWLTRDSADTTPPPAAANLTAVAGVSQVQLAWTNPSAIDLAKVRLLLRHDRCPTGPADGTILLDRTATWGPDEFTHSGAATGIRHYYAVFLGDSVNWSGAACVSAMPHVAPDFDEDGDVDQNDFGHLQECFSGDFVPQEEPDCTDAILDGDNDVDGGDLSRLLGCLSGTNTLAEAGCAD